MILLNKNIFLLLLGYMSITFALANTNETTKQENCKKGYFSIVTGDYNKTPEKICLSDTKNTFTLKTGNNFIISLPSKPSTGSSWGLIKMPNPIMLTNVNYQQSSECKEPMVGCGGMTTYAFQAINKGKGTIKLTYGRIWEKNKGDYLTIKINVK